MEICPNNGKFFKKATEDAHTDTVKEWNSDGHLSNQDGLGCALHSKQHYTWTRQHRP